MDNKFVHPYANDMDVVEAHANPWTRPYLPYHYNGDISYYEKLENDAAAEKAKNEKKTFAQI